MTPNPSDITIHICFICFPVITLHERGSSVQHSLDSIAQDRQGHSRNGSTRSQNELFLQFMYARLHKQQHKYSEQTYIMLTRSQAAFLVVQLRALTLKGHPVFAFVSALNLRISRYFVPQQQVLQKKACHMQIFKNHHPTQFCCSGDGLCSLYDQYCTKHMLTICRKSCGTYSHQTGSYDLYNLILFTKR